MYHSSGQNQTTPLYALAIILTYSSDATADDGDLNARASFEQAFATSIVLFDNDAITFGVYDFDPNIFSGFSNESFGSQSALELRNNLTAYSFPITIFVSETDKYSSNTLIRLSYLRNEFTIPWEPQLEPDSYQEQTFDFLLGYQRDYPLNRSLSLLPELSAHLMYFTNTLDYNSDYLLPARPSIDGVTVNTSAWSAVLESKLELRFTKVEDWGRWYAFSIGHYFYGNSWGKANHGDLGNPEGHYYLNGFKAFVDLPKGIVKPTIFSSIERVDIRGDAMAFFDTNHYYKASMAVLIDAPYKNNYIENLGIGLNFNYGSSLNGISLTIYLNQE